MSRKKISEYRAKTIVCEALEIPYVGWSVATLSDVKKIKGYSEYVVKVDQAVKGRFKKGLVKLGVKQRDIASTIDDMRAEGYASFIVEPLATHKADDERYLSIGLGREGLVLAYSSRGGIDIEAHPESINTALLNESTDWRELADAVALSEMHLRRLVMVCQREFFSFLEINPYIVADGEVSILDCAVEVDDAGAYFTDSWNETDIRTPRRGAENPAETRVHALDAKSPASFNLSVINPDGSIFLLLSGGGASVVIADEINNVGLGKELGNYGEYSGNPNAQETYIYANEVLQLLLHSGAPRKILFVGGAVANFTDIASTFSGVIKAIDENAEELKKQKVKIFVRRGGPRQEIGLRRIGRCLEQHELLGGVYDPTTSITDALTVAVKEVQV